MNFTLLTTPETVSRGRVVIVAAENNLIPYEVVWVTRKTLSLKRKRDKVRKTAYWSEKKGCYSVDNKYSVT
ncbi:hypothetical protein NE686_17545 [Tissierella carlieri]|uniref:Uncharacterized protein n=1 Tax=Tissierella carlieri TaxID=689904 RepID=A0ABT1SEL6_9FIRM|nr:hypothetical protein [Tissierella carlieri]MCQ4924910.1 hypothetical protein [Tissierella carlieri]